MVLLSLAVVTALSIVALTVALCVVGGGLSDRLDDADREVGVLRQRVADVEAENDYLFEEREGEEERRLDVCLLHLAFAPSVGRNTNLQVGPSGQPSALSINLLLTSIYYTAPTTTVCGITQKGQSPSSNDSL